MKYSVLGIGYAPSEYEEECSEWIKHGIVFDFAVDLKDAVEKLGHQNYICTVIKSDQVSHKMLSFLRKVKPTPTVILPSSYSAAEAHIFSDLCVLQYARATGQHDIALLDGDERLKRVLGMQPEQREALTIITVKDLSFCLEHRSVEICGREVVLEPGRNNHSGAN